jgi:eukaryotic-like serine/threonine-protein kinase
VFDGGATPEGRPFFAMEYVKGEPITSYCVRRRLTLQPRIDLFLEVCDGVQHAHQKGIIHRDLKPSNILVTERDNRPVPKIIDFGVAKAMTQSLADRTLYTELGALIGTPEYMSPEQADMSGLDVDTRTDVYALGVVLYELLTGVLPFDSKYLRDRPLDDIRRTIREVDPSRPSTRLASIIKQRSDSPTSVATSATPGELRGDLDWITMKALEKDRTRRYGSASDIAADLRRHLDNLPVLASTPSTVYRMGKFVRRHHIGVAISAVLVVLLVVFAATMAFQTRRIAKERDRANAEASRANREAETAQQTSDFLTSLFTVSDPAQARGSTMTAREVLDNGAKQIDALGDQPLVQARLQRTLGSVYLALGLYSQADALLDASLATNRRLLGPDHRQTIDTSYDVGELRFSEGRFAEAEAAYREVANKRHSMLGPHARDTLEAEMAVASACSKQGRDSEAERLFDSTIGQLRRSFGDNDPLTLNALNELETMYYRQGRYAEALPIAELVWTGMRKIAGDDAPRTIVAQGNVADNLGKLRRFDESERLYEAAFALQQRVLGSDHPIARRTITKFAAMYEDWGKPGKAAELRAKLPKGAVPQP